MTAPGAQGPAVGTSTPVSDAAALLPTSSTRPPWPLFQALRLFPGPSLSPPLPAAVTGRDLDGTGLTRFVEEFFGGHGRVTSVDFERLDLFVHGDAAYELGRYEETADVGGETEHVAGNYFLRWERSEDGAWRIDRFVGGPIDSPDL